MAVADASAAVAAVSAAAAGKWDCVILSEDWLMSHKNLLCHPERSVSPLADSRGVEEPAPSEAEGTPIAMAIFAVAYGSLRVRFLGCADETYRE